MGLSNHQTDLDLAGRCILSVAFPFAAVSENSVGGAEQVLASLDQAITASGGRSIVVAHEGSHVSGTLIGVPQSPGQLTKEKQAGVWREYRHCIRAALNQFPVDLIHFHGIDFFEYMPSTAIAKLVTLHLPPHWYPREVFNRTEEAGLFLHCVSESQQRACPPSNCLLSPIYNGVSIPPDAPSRALNGDFVLSLGRICPEKGFHLALDAAKQAGIKMILAGAVFEYETHQRYFEDEIVPRLDDQRRFTGPVGKDEKRGLMSAARCLLIPSLAPETSSLVAIEALACGTPVVAFPNGALTEIIEHGCNGFLVQDAGEMAVAIKMAGALSAEKCWASVRHRFSSGRMVTQYLERYLELTPDPS